MGFLLFTFGSNYVQRRYYTYGGYSLLATGVCKCEGCVFFSNKIEGIPPCDILIINILAIESSQMSSLPCAKCKCIIYTDRPFASLIHYCKLRTIIKHRSVVLDVSSRIVILRMDRWNPFYTGLLAKLFCGFKHRIRRGLQLARRTGKNILGEIGNGVPNHKVDLHWGYERKRLCTTPMLGQDTHAESNALAVDTLQTCKKAKCDQHCNDFLHTIYHICKMDTDFYINSRLGVLAFKLNNDRMTNDEQTEIDCGLEANNDPEVLTTHCNPMEPARSDPNTKQISHAVVQYKRYEYDAASDRSNEPIVYKTRRILTGRSIINVQHNTVFDDDVPRRVFTTKIMFPKPAPQIYTWHSKLFQPDPCYLSYVWCAIMLPYRYKSNHSNMAYVLALRRLRGVHSSQ